MTLVCILERIDSHVSLIRAAAVCKQWRRVIADAAFLRRFRSLHAPHVPAVAGDYHHDTYRANLEPGGNVGPVFVPAWPWINARHFALDFLPDLAYYPPRWDILDSRGSLLLMRRIRPPLLSVGMFHDIYVCEPLTRRYLRIPAEEHFNDSYVFEGCYLIDGNAAGQSDCRVGTSNFRVLFLCTRDDDLASVVTTFNFSDGAGSSWSERITSGPRAWMMRIAGRVSGFWFFYDEDFYGEDGMLTMLDCSSGEFRFSNLPSTKVWDRDARIWNHCSWVTECRDGKLCNFTISGDGSMKVFVRLDDGAWVLRSKAMVSEMVCDLPGYQPSFFRYPPGLVTRGPGFVVLSPLPKVSWFFSIQLDTLEVALVPDSMVMGWMMYRCELPWPPTCICLMVSFLWFSDLILFWVFLLGEEPSSV